MILNRPLGGILGSSQHKLVIQIIKLCLESLRDFVIRAVHVKLLPRYSESVKSRFEGLWIKVFPEKVISKYMKTSSFPDLVIAVTGTVGSGECRAPVHLHSPP